MPRAAQRDHWDGLLGPIGEIRVKRARAAAKSFPTLWLRYQLRQVQPQEMAFRPIKPDD
jgi:hypothetical protein